MSMDSHLPKANATRQKACSAQRATSRVGGLKKTIDDLPATDDLGFVTVLFEQRNRFWNASVFATRRQEKSFNSPHVPGFLR
jgi:hypothetical protein